MPDRTQVLTDELGLAEEKLAQLGGLVFNGGKDDLSKEFRQRLMAVLDSKPDKHPGFYIEDKGRLERERDLLFHIAGELNALAALAPMTRMAAKKRSLRLRLRTATRAARALSGVVYAVGFGDLDYAESNLQDAKKVLNAHR